MKVSFIHEKLKTKMIRRNKFFIKFGKKLFIILTNIESS